MGALRLVGRGVVCNRLCGLLGWRRKSRLGGLPTGMPFFTRFLIAACTVKVECHAFRLRAGFGARAPVVRVMRHRHVTPCSTCVPLLL